jgi:hypothetical protein
MKDKRYNEFKVKGRIVKGQFVIDSKEPTDRKSVMISDRDAQVNNQQTRFTYLHYELAEKKAKSFADLKKDDLIAYIQEKEYEIDINQNKPELVKAVEEIEK